MKTITIGGKDYEVECNAYTIFEFKKMFKNSIFNDVQIIKDYLLSQILITNQLREENPDISDIDLSTKLNDKMLEKLDDFLESITKIAYIMIYKNKNVKDYEGFLKELKCIKLDDAWIVEVAEIAVDCFC